jgi:DNA-binding PadR family transcriptional regulator
MAKDPPTAARQQSSRPRQEDRLLPLGGYQYLTLVACDVLDGATALTVHEALERAGLPETNLGQVYVTLKRLFDRGFLSAARARSEVDATRVANIYMLTKEGKAILRKADENYRLVSEVATKLTRKRGRNPIGMTGRIISPDLPVLGDGGVGDEGEEVWSKK